MNSQDAMVIPVRVAETIIDEIDDMAVRIRATQAEPVPGVRRHQPGQAFEDRDRLDGLTPFEHDVGHLVPHRGPQRPGD